MQTALNRQPGSRQTTKSGLAAALWLVQAMSGILLLLLLLLHMVAHHFVVEGGLRNFQEVLAYVSNPVIFFLEVVFLAVVTLHAMLGLRAVILDVGLSPRQTRLLNGVLTVLGMVTLVYGIWLAVSIQQMG